MKELRLKNILTDKKIIKTINNKFFISTNYILNVKIILKYFLSVLVIIR